MRHKVKIRKLNRSQGHYRATMASLAGALITHKQIKTTLSRAKELRPYVEKLITHAKEDSVSKRRLVYQKLNDRKLVYELFHVIGPQNSDRNGGYSRIIKLGQRRGDGAEMAMIELIGFEQFGAAKAKTKAKSATAKAKKEEPLLDLDASEAAPAEIADAEIQTEEAEVVETEIAEAEPEEAEAEVKEAPATEAETDQTDEKAEAPAEEAAADEAEPEKGQDDTAEAGEEEKK